MPCKLRSVTKFQETLQHQEIPTRGKPQDVCIVESHETARKRTEETQQKDHKDHIAEQSSVRCVNTILCTGLSLHTKQ